MSKRARQLQTTAAEQIDELVALFSKVDEATLRRPCPGREKLGDGTLAAALQHTAHNYSRIADFVQTIDRMPSTHAPTRFASQRIPRLLRAWGHPGTHASHRSAHGPHEDPYAAENIDAGAVLAQLFASRDTLGQIELTDSQLDAIPPKDSFRFCDGQRTLEQVLAGLRHQRHQVDTVAAAIR
jgi:hypothetical protein